MKRRRRPSALLAAIALASTSGCGSCEGRRPPPATPITASAVETELATLDLPELAAALPAGSEPPRIEAVVSPTGTAGAFVVRSGSTARLVHGRTVTPPYPAIDRVTFSPDGLKVAFAIREENQKLHVVVDGRPGPAFDELEGLVFTRDGRLAYKGLQGERWRLVVDGAAGEGQHRLGGLRVGADGLTVVVAERPTPSAPFAVAAYDPKLRRKVLREITAEDVALSEDASLAAAFVAADGGTKVTAFAPLAQGPLREGTAYDEVIGLAFGPRGANVLFAARQGDRLLVVLDGKAEPLPAASLAGMPVLDPARGVVGVALAGERAFAHFAFDPNAPKPRLYEAVSEVTFSPDGSRRAYVAEQQGRAVVVVNGAEGPSFDRVVTPRFSPDGASLVYRARQDGKRFLVVADADGKILRRHPAYEQVFQPIFTPDGASVAYAVKEGPRLVSKVEKLR